MEFLVMDLEFLEAQVRNISNKSFSVITNNV